MAEVEKKQEGAGRPSEKTPEVIRKIEEVAALDGSIEEMAYYANVHRATLYRWLKEDQELSDRVKALRERPILKARQTINKSLDNPEIAKWYMERKKKLEFSPRQEMTGADGSDIPVRITGINYIIPQKANQDNANADGPAKPSSKAADRTTPDGKAAPGVDSAPVANGG